MSWRGRPRGFEAKLQLALTIAALIDLGLGSRPSLKNEHRLIPKLASRVGSHLRGDRVAMGGFGAPVRSEIGPSYQAVARPCEV